METKQDFTTLVEDSRTFDVECVRSALEFVNRATAGDAEPAQAFAWAPAICIERVSRAGMFDWAMSDRVKEPKPELSLRIARQFLLTLSYVLPPDQKLIDVAEIRRWLQRPENVTRYSKLPWQLDRCDFLPLEPGKRKPAISVPMMSDVGSCLTYALALLFESDWGLAERVRACRYRGRSGDEPVHYFLDYRTDDAGQLKRGTPLAFCSSEHANRYRQQEWRRRHAAKNRSLGKQVGRRVRR